MVSEVLFCSIASQMPKYCPSIPCSRSTPPLRMWLLVISVPVLVSLSVNQCVIDLIVRFLYTDDNPAILSRARPNLVLISSSHVAVALNLAPRYLKDCRLLPLVSYLRYRPTPWYGRIVRHFHCFCLRTLIFIAADLTAPCTLSVRFCNSCLVFAVSTISSACRRLVTSLPHNSIMAAVKPEVFYLNCCTYVVFCYSVTRVSIMVI